MGDRITDLEKQQREAHDSATRKHVKCGGVEAATGHLQRRKCQDEEKGMTV